MIASPAKFTFDLDLADQRNACAPTRNAPNDAARAQEAEKSRMEGYADGFSEGEQSALASAAQQLGMAAETLASQSSQMLTDLDETRNSVQRDGVELAASIARKLAGNLLAREPAAEIEALLTECLAWLDGVPHLVIRCHPELADKVRELAKPRIVASGFEGRLMVMGDPDRKLGDARIEWADGGLVRDIGAISAEIDKSIASYMAARGANGARKVPK